MRSGGSGIVASRLLGCLFSSHVCVAQSNRQDGTNLMLCFLPLCPCLSRVFQAPQNLSGRHTRKCEQMTYVCVCICAATPPTRYLLYFCPSLSSPINKHQHPLALCATNNNNVNNDSHASCKHHQRYLHQPHSSNPFRNQILLLHIHLSRSSFVARIQVTLLNISNRNMYTTPL